MTSIPMKPNPFKEKMTAVKIYQRDELNNFNELRTMNFLDFTPASITLVVEMIFFNVMESGDYGLVVTANLPDNTTYPVYAARLNIDPNNIEDATTEGYGKASATFSFNLALQKPSDMYFLFTLLDSNGEEIDQFYSYHTFLKD